MSRKKRKPKNFVAYNLATIGAIVNPVEVKVFKRGSVIKVNDSDCDRSCGDPIPDREVPVSPKAGETYNEESTLRAHDDRLLDILRSIPLHSIPQGVCVVVPLVAMIKAEDLPFLTGGSCCVTSFRIHETVLNLSSVIVSPRVVPESPKGGTDE